MLTEVWKDIEQYEGLYQVSDLGRIKSLAFGKDRILKPAINTGGYHFVRLCRKGIIKSALVHRLVAIAFIPNPNNLPEVNHTKGDKSDNRVIRLEWATSSANKIHAFTEGLMANHRKAFAEGRVGRKRGAAHPKARKVTDPVTGTVYDTLKDAAVAMGISRQTLRKRLG